MTRRRTALLALGLAPGLVLSVLTATPAAAAPRFAPERTVAAPTCARAGGGAGGGTDAVYAAGAIRGFVSFNSETCGDAIHYVQGGSQGWTRVATPYRGVPLAVAADEVSTYLVFLSFSDADQPDRVRITKRDHSGHFWPVTTLSHPLGTTVPSADVGAHGGRWWAVWDEQVGPGGEFAHAQLFTARTFGAAQGRTRLTSTATDVADTEASISVDAHGMVLAWRRQSQPARPGPSDLWVATSTGGALRNARALSTQGEQNGAPDVLRRGATLLAWVRDGRIVEADNASGAFRSHQFLVGGDRPRVGASSGSSFVSWTTGTETDASARGYVAQGSKGSTSFRGGYATPTGHDVQAAVAVNGRLTVLSRTRSAVVSRTGSP
jgi:hypothetical protein